MPSEVSLYPNTVEIIRRIDFMLREEAEDVMIRDIDITFNPQKSSGKPGGWLSFSIIRYSNGSWHEPAAQRGRRRARYEWEGNVLKVTTSAPAVSERRIGRDETGKLRFV